MSNIAVGSRGSFPILPPIRIMRVSSSWTAAHSRLGDDIVPPFLHTLVSKFRIYVESRPLYSEPYPPKMKTSFPHTTAVGDPMCGGCAHS